MKAIHNTLSETSYNYLPANYKQIYKIESNSQLDDVLTEEEDTCEL